MLQPKPDGVEDILPTPDTIQLALSDQPGADVPIPLTCIEVTGSTIFGSAEFDLIIKPLEGRSVTLAELNSVAQQITQLY